MRLHVALEINVVALLQVSNRKWPPKQVVRKILKWLPEHVFTKIFDTQKWPPNTWSRKYFTHKNGRQTHGHENIWRRYKRAAKHMVTKIFDKQKGRKTRVYENIWWKMLFTNIVNKYSLFWWIFCLGLTAWPSRMSTLGGKKMSRTLKNDNLFFHKGWKNYFGHFGWLKLLLIFHTCIQISNFIFVVQRIKPAVYSTGCPF